MSSGPINHDRVHETTTTTGTGDISLAGAESNCQSLSVVGDGNTLYYAIVARDNSAWEKGLGTFHSGTPNTLTRTRVDESSNSNSAVNFGAGVKDVFCGPSALAATVREQYDDGTSNKPVALTIRHDGSGTPVAGFGVTTNFDLKDSTTQDINAASIIVSWIVSTHGSTTSRATINVSGLEAIRAESDGTNALVALGGAAVQAHVQLYAQPITYGSTGNNSGTKLKPAIWVDVPWDFDTYFYYTSFMVTERGGGANLTLIETGYNHTGTASGLFVNIFSAGRNGISGSTVASVYIGTNTEFNGSIWTRSPLRDCNDVTGLVIIDWSGTGTKPGTPAGTSTTYARFGGCIFDHYADVSTTHTDGTEDTLYSDTLPVNILHNNGEKLEAEYTLTVVSSATATREIQLRLLNNSVNTVVADTGTLTFTATGTVILKVRVIRESTSILRVSTELEIKGLTQDPILKYTRITGLDCTATIELRLTGIAASTGAASADIVAVMGSGRWGAAA